MGAVGFAVFVDVACAILICGKLQFARNKAMIDKDVIMDGSVLRFTAVKIIIPA